MDDAGYMMHDARCRIHDARCKMQDIGGKMRYTMRDGWMIDSWLCSLRLEP